MLSATSYLSGQTGCTPTTFFPVGDDIRAVVVDWVTYLRFAKLWGLDDPLFPATKVALVEATISDSVR